MFHLFFVRLAHDGLPRLRSNVVAAMTLLVAATPIQAQTPLSSTWAQPLDPEFSVPAVVYASSLTTSKALRENPPLSWRQANDNVARIGGWRAYAREAQQPDTTAAPAAPKAVSPMQHHGHHGHKSP